MIKEEIKEKLFSAKSSDRRKAAKEIGHLKLLDFSSDLLVAYIDEKKDKRTWETQVEMILALGLVGYKPTLFEILSIIKQNKPHDMITYAAAQTYVRLTRHSLHDAQPVIELLKFGGLSLVDGALKPLGDDRMMPPQEEITKIIELSWNLHGHKDRIGNENGYMDPRYGLIVACAGWDIQLTKDFLNHCLLTSGNDTSILKVVQNSLKGKF